ncbi:MAG: hypothetical protein ACWGNO_02520 [Desulfobacterales bacterium]
MRSLSRRALTLFAPIIFMTIFGGCLSPLAIQAVGGAAGGAAPSASDYRGAGKGESYFIAHYEDVIQAVLKSGKILSLELEEKKVDKERAFLRYLGGKENKINLVIESRTETMTSIHFDVGWSGSIAFGRLMAQQIHFELKDAGAFLVDWTPDTVD